MKFVLNIFVFVLLAFMASCSNDDTDNLQQLSCEQSNITTCKTLTFEEAFNRSMWDKDDSQKGEKLIFTDLKWSNVTNK